MKINAKKTKAMKISKRPSEELIFLCTEDGRGIYSYFKKGCGKNVHATIPKGNMGYDQYNVPDTAAF